MVLRKVLWFVFLSSMMAGVCSAKSLQLLNSSYKYAQANTVGNKPVAVEPSVKTLSNRLVKICIDSSTGTYDLIDLKRNEVFVKDAEIVLTTAPYRELSDVKEGDSESTGPVHEYRSRAGQNRIKSETYLGVFGKGDALTLTSTFAQDAEVQVRFVLYPDRTFIDIGWTFCNKGTEPVRLRRLSVLQTNQVFPGRDQVGLKMINGDSGGKKNRIFDSEAVKAENNMLYFLADEVRPRSLVLGGLTYAAPHRRR